ncbi:raffinose synthase or seed imbibition protein Sip1-domain-containing protein [Melampsora americana]|nr:raffinose synthase or seed imbibition protein Sip1-domain-containing protein [Melampsora americana]
MTFSFNPSLGSILHIRPDPKTDRCVLNFYAYEEAQDEEIFSSDYTNSRIPEIWTNVRLWEESDESTNPSIWKSIVFKRIKSNHHPFKSNQSIWQAKVCLKSQPSELYHFTYRLSKGKDQKVKWLGSNGDNGQIKVNDGLDENLVEEDPFLIQLKLNSTHHTFIQSPLQITTHLFTYPFPTKLTHQTSSSPVHQQSLINSNEESLNSIQGLLYERSKPTWYNPRSITSFNQISQEFDTQAIIFKRPIHDHLAVVLWPISHQTQSFTFRRNSTSQLILCSNLTQDHQSSDDDQPQLAVSIGPDWALQQLISAAVGNSELSEPFPKGLLPQKLRYCTWNALGPDYRLSDLFKALEDLEESKLAHLIDSILLDDGWQDTNGRTLSGWGTKKDWVDKETILSESKHSKLIPESQVNHFKDVHSEANDLKMAVNQIRQSGRGNIKYVGVWITLNGYWEGLNPKSDTMKVFELQKWSVQDPKNLSDHQHSTWYLPKISRISDFWNTYFSSLKSAGVDFVKVDNQAGLDYVYRCESEPLESAQSLRSTLWTSMNLSALKIFGVDPIYPLVHCMAHSPHIWGSRPSRLIESGKLSSPTAQWVMRTSDDFFPDERNPDAHRWHLISNAFNSLLACGIGFTPDFDMTMTRHPFSAYHTALRVFSPSPIYITDRIGEHDLVTSRKITSALKSGGFGVLQSNGRPGTILAGRSLGLEMDRLTDDSTSWGLLKIGLSLEEIGGGLMGVWNVKKNAKVELGLDVITKRDLSEALAIDFLKQDSVDQIKDIMIYSRNQRTLTVLNNLNQMEEIQKPNHSSDPVMTVSLRENTFDLLTISQIWIVPGLSEIGIATFGVLDGFCGLAGIRKVEEIEIDQKKVQLTTHSEPERKALGMIEERRMVPLKPIEKVRKSMNSFKPYGRLRFLFHYLIQDEKEGYWILKSLLQDFIKSPIRTIFSEGFAILKMSIGLSVLLTSGLIFQFLPDPLRRKGNERFKSEVEVKRDERMGFDFERDEVDEGIGILKCSDEKRKGNEGFGNEDLKEKKLRFKTRFTNLIGFGLRIKRKDHDHWIKTNENQRGLKRLKSLRDLLVFKVDGEIVESSLRFEKIKTTDDDDDDDDEEEEEEEELKYLVYLDLEQFAQTHLVDEVNENEWLIEIEGVNLDS